MNPIKQIGPFSIPVAAVIAIQKRTGFWGFLFPGYDVFLQGGVKLRLTEAEKLKLDEEMKLHQETMQVLGMVGYLQQANSPGR